MLRAYCSFITGVYVFWCRIRERKSTLLTKLDFTKAISLSMNAHYNNYQFNYGSMILLIKLSLPTWI